ncbi:hypothetical protein BCR35DRAFT_349034 [Leucosporidium creatinivorum]|uniref:Fe2OG dioxygenase domain-containing protein n=1 Tax=Leucosporidium creatinivorum TaxID=106004 RepID=A0A1Y2G6L0_9BASI|nr:hypothetical protein BCR35DRAFT_349034 [Leucosporidium creatinivorum]
MTLEASPIPLIDPNSCSSSELAAAIASAVSSVGFLHLKLSDELRAQAARAFSISKELFDEPLEHRLRCPNENGNGHVRFQANRLEESKGAGDLKENFVYGRHGMEESKTSQPLPPSLKRNQAEVDVFHASCYKLTCTLLDAFSVALNLPPEYFVERHFQGGCGMAFINYPPVASGAGAEGVARASAHKDWGSLTLLFQEEQGTPGLEVYLADAAVEAVKSSKPMELMSDLDLAKCGQWFPAPIIPGTVLVNVGLAMEGWTGGLFKATLHRVLTHSAPDGSFSGRKSIAYFVQPSDNVVLNPIAPDGTITITSSALTSKAFYEARMAASAAAAAASS